ncbi:hypothetical protein DERP_005950 [Dermatophagoides pteronyssinus]|uniref:Uncharacterized protein n=1 Tax=Dermatophagoides pteronyssinus TaxID=6956 RepID=A0ABQ8JRV9_DERPT|nr:hypothetical protein DERP_005950 [Dermatophagoides pteronyssinus]
MLMAEFLFHFPSIHPFIYSIEFFSFSLVRLIDSSFTLKIQQQQQQQNIIPRSKYVCTNENNNNKRAGQISIVEFE